MSEQPYPEHDRLRAVSDESQKIGEYMEWLAGQGLVVAHLYNGSQLALSHRSIEDLLAAYFAIDLDKLEAEKRAMIAALREGP